MEPKTSKARKTHVFHGPKVPPGPRILLTRDHSEIWLPDFTRNSWKKPFFSGDFGGNSFVSEGALFDTLTGLDERGA